MLKLITNIVADCTAVNSGQALQEQHSPFVFLFFCLSGVFVGPGGTAQSTLSLSTVAAVAPGHRPLDTTTVSLSNVFPCSSLPPPLHLRLLRPFHSSPPALPD